LEISPNITAMLILQRNRFVEAHQSRKIDCKMIFITLFHYRYLIPEPAARSAVRGY
jgi:hypothetical protein